MDDFNRLDPLSGVTPSRHTASIVEMRRTEMESKYGAGGKAVMRKADFISAHRSFKYSPWMGSKELQESVDHYAPAIAEFLEDGGEKLESRIEEVSTNAGIFAGNLSTMEGIGDPREDDPVFAGFYKAVLKELKTCYNRGLDTKNINERLLGFRRESSPGVMVDYPDLSCNYSVEAKNQILDLSADRKFTDRPVSLVTYRVQLDKMNKKRISCFFDKPSSLVEGFMYNPSGRKCRIRHALALCWDRNTWLMGVNALINLGLQGADGGPQSVLYSMWKTTHADFDAIGRRTPLMYPKCGDIGNNDMRQNWPLTRDFHAQILPPWMFDEWLRVYEDGDIIGCYPDADEKKRYYSVNLNGKHNHSRLYSGEGLTSWTNRSIHLSNQLACAFVASGGKEGEEPSPEVCYDFMCQRVNLTYNNGDDIFDLFESQAVADKYEERLTATKWIPIEMEPPGMSGIGFTLNEKGQMTGAQAKMSTLFYKVLETERRDYDSALGRLPYSSIAGKLSFFDSFNYRDDAIIADAKALFLDVVGLKGYDDQRIREEAAKEIATAEAENSRQLAINKILSLLGEVESHVLAWKYSFDEIKAVAPELAEELFISRPLTQFIDTTWRHHV